MGKEYWSGLINWLRNTVLPSGHLDKEELGLFTVTDDPKEVVRIIKASMANQPS
jgi:predicted Rossmann-fold nucleotide-binding protein